MPSGSCNYGTLAVCTASEGQGGVRARVQASGAKYMCNDTKNSGSANGQAAASQTRTQLGSAGMYLEDVYVIASNPVWQQRLLPQVGPCNLRLHANVRHSWTLSKTKGVQMCTMGCKVNWLLVIGLWQQP